MLCALFMLETVLVTFFVTWPDLAKPGLQLQVPKTMPWNDKLHLHSLA